MGLQAGAGARVQETKHDLAQLKKGLVAAWADFELTVSTSNGPLEEMNED